jgi:hypothetical protein
VVEAGVAAKTPETKAKPGGIQGKESGEGHG